MPFTPSPTTALATESSFSEESDDDCVDGASCVDASCVLDDGGDDAGTDAGDEADSGTGDTDAGSDTDPGDDDEAEDGGCSCRTAGGNSGTGHLAWAGLALAFACMRRARWV